MKLHKHLSSPKLVTSLHTYTYVGMFTDTWVHMCACVQKILHHSSTLLIESRSLSHTQSWPIWLVSLDILLQDSVSTFCSWNYSWAIMLTWHDVGFDDPIPDPIAYTTSALPIGPILPPPPQATQLIFKVSKTTRH